jgi:hypothetical protein
MWRRHNAKEESKYEGGNKCLKEDLSMFQNAQLAGDVRLHARAGMNCRQNILPRRVPMKTRLSYPVVPGLR